LFASVSKNGNFIENYPEWLKIYEEFKERLFKTLLDEELCTLGFSIIKEFLETEPIHAEVIAASRSELARLLSNPSIIQAMYTQKEARVKQNQTCSNYSDT